ncbi:aspartate aminotransferase [Penicillium waksmanii]|uniref:aspartate aminotransferase n=1 Tax=Penicillium waksmanii TaxID=69791 RepID=UPI002548C8CB|nr:aspartate aminotransferase [Penicillium waksmanii]KAJ5963092.1 aspartate aminotransferase [Penicillium waksmanii]
MDPMEGNLSGRGKAFATEKPTFLEVLSDLWDPVSNPDGIVNIGLAENTLMHAEMERFINSNLQIDTHALTYGDGFNGSHKLKGAICHFLNRLFSPQIALQPSHLAITSGVSNAIECCAWALGDSGDYILVGRPYFNAFKTIFGTRPGINLLEVTFGATDPFSMAAVKEYEKAYAESKSKNLRIKALLLCSPHNPLGFRRDRSQDWLFDYLHNFPSSLADQVGTSLLLDDTFTREYIATNQIRLAESYRFATEFLQSHHIQYVECNAAFFIWMNLGAAVKNRTASDKDILTRLRKERVYVAAGTNYAAEEAGWFRMVFAHPQTLLSEGLNRMLRAIQS